MSRSCSCRSRCRPTPSSSPSSSRRRESTSTVFGSDSVFSPKDFHPNGAYVSAFAPDIHELPADAKLVAAFKAAYGNFSTPFGPPVYTSTNVILRAIKAACAQGQPTRASVLAQIRKTKIAKTILGGPLSFSKHGEPTAHELLRLQGRKRRVQARPLRRIGGRPAVALPAAPFRMPLQSVTLNDIERASRIIRGRLVRTPVLALRRPAGARRGRAAPQSRALSANRLVQATGGAEQARGTDSEERARGLLAVSSGNHAQAVAACAAEQGLDCLLVMPQGASEQKASAAAAYGATRRPEPDEDERGDRPRCRARAYNRPRLDPGLRRRAL